MFTAGQEPTSAPSQRPSDAQHRAPTARSTALLLPLRPKGGEGSSLLFIVSFKSAALLRKQREGQWFCTASGAVSPPPSQSRSP